MSHWKLILFSLVVGLLITACGVPVSSLRANEQSSRPEVAPAQAQAQPSPVLALLPSTATPASQANCPTTTPQNPSFTPPPPWPSKSLEGEFWYGTNVLWTSVPKDGLWWGLPKDKEGYSQKVWFWKQGYDGLTDPRPKLTVTGRRLDGAAPPLVTLPATDGYNKDMGWAMLVGVDVPTLGCWEITGHSDGHPLSFVIRVDP